MNAYRKPANIVLSTLELPKLLEFPKVADARGCLCFVEARKHVPFDIERVYFINDVPNGESRGSHAHKTLRQVLIVLSGCVTIDLDDCDSKKTFQLSRANQGLYLPAGYWRTMRDFTSGAVCLSLTSAYYDADDYIHNYDEYAAWRQKSLV